MVTLEDPTLTFYERRLDAARETIARLTAENAQLKKLANANHVHRWSSYSTARPFCVDCGATLNLGPM